MHYQSGQTSLLQHPPDVSPTLITTRRPAVPAGTRHGGVLPFVCILLAALIASVALAVDFGRLYVTVNEVQGVTDAAALAGVAGMQFAPWSASSAAPSFAQRLAAANRAAGRPGSVATADVVPMFYDPVANTMSAASYSSANAVQTTARAQSAYALAGAVGIAPRTVGRRATAWIGNMVGGACVRPVAPSFTRMYEVASGLTWRPYSSQHQYAPDVSQTQIALLSPSSPWPIPAVDRTFVMIPPWSSEAHWDSAGQPITGLWHTVNYGGAGWPAFSTNMAVPAGDPSCAGATAQVGGYLYPFTWQPSDSASLTSNYITPGFVQFCHQYGSNGAYDATCRNADGSAGVIARVPLVDSIPSRSGTFSQRIRMVTQLRIMCYFQTSQATCPGTQVTNAAGQSVWWQMPSNNGSGPPVTSGYTPATVVVLIEGPISIDLTPDIQLGNTPSLTQRLVLVR